ncbi:MAG: NEW3 domain-containing protein [Thermoplasmata archaeon]
MFALLLLASGGAGEAVSCWDKRDGGCAAGPRDMLDEGGLYWRDDVQLTNDSAEEQAPVILDYSGLWCFVCWHSGGGHYLKKIDRLGGEVFSGKLIVSAPLPTQHNGQPLERAGIDSGGSLHYVWRGENWYHLYYQKFDGDGRALCPPVNLSGIDNMPHVLTVAVGKNRTAYFAHEVEGGDSVKLGWVDANFNVHSRYMVTSSAEGVVLGADGEGSLHVITRSSISNGYLSHTRLSPEGSLEVAAHIVEIPVPGNAWKAPMPQLVIGRDRAIHLLQASALSGQRNLYYTKLDRSGVKLVNDITISTSAADYGDLCTDPAGNVYIVWGDAGNGELYYVRIERNNENETLSPVRLTFSDGPDTDPRISADGNGGLHIVWRALRDGRWDLYYKYADPSGVRLFMIPEEQCGLNLIRPGETKWANLTVLNTGAFNDTALLSIALESHGRQGWAVSLSEESVELGPFEMKQVGMSLAAPRSGRPGDFVDISVACRSVSAPLRVSTVSLRSWYITSEGICLNASGEPLLAEPGGSALHAVIVHNTGSGVEDIELRAEGPPEWGVSLDRGSIEGLGAGELAEVFLTVAPPPWAEAGSMAICTVTGWLRSNPEIRDAVSLRTVVSRAIELELEASPPSAAVAPGGEAFFALTISHIGNSPEQVEFGLGAEPAVEGWSATVEPPALGMRGGEWRDAVLTVSAPADAIAGAGCAVRVVCRERGGVAFAECTVRAVVAQERALSVSVAPPDAPLAPGGMTTYVVSVLNRGNGDDAVRLGKFTAPEGWGLRVETLDNAPLGEGSVLAVARGGSVHFYITVQACEGALAGTYGLTGELFDGGGGRYELSAVADVSVVRGIGLEVLNGTAACEPGGPAVFEVWLLNRGNARERVVLEMTGLPEGWEGAFFRGAPGGEVAAVEVPPQGRVALRAVVFVPQGARESAADATICARFAPDGAEVALVRVNVLRPELRIAGVAPIGKAEVGRPVRVEVVVENGGGAEARAVQLAYRKNGALRLVEELGDIPAGANRTVAFIWVPVEGRNELGFTADPWNRINELNESDNSAILVRSFRVERVWLERYNWALAAVAALVVAEVTLLAALRARASPRERAGAEARGETGKAKDGKRRAGSRDERSGAAVRRAGAGGEGKPDIRGGGEGSRMGRRGSGRS